MSLKTLKLPNVANTSHWVLNNSGNYNRLNYTTQQTEVSYGMPNKFDGVVSNKRYSDVSLPQDIVMPSLNNSNTNSVVSPNVVDVIDLSDDYQSRLLGAFDKSNQLTEQYLTNQRNANITNGVIGGLTSAANIGLGIWGAIEQYKLNKEQIANMKAQREMWAEQISASREARTQRREELARLNKMRSNTKAQFNTQSRVSRSY